MIAVDTSAIFAILNRELEAIKFRELIVSQPAVFMSVASVLELELAVTRLQLDATAPTIDAILDDMGIDIVAFDEHQLTLARDAFHRFGKGRHPAGLNFGDCFAYALAASLKAPLLFKGDDFSQTDIRSAVPAQGAT